ncbi:hypothetical protein RB195_026182 [Necator americanus]|uniref:ER lumen protein-retaining receptor n=1 Tax=Necator americanus TaxID=51031 RepID=A0ABR1EW09_NECAM
MNIFRLSADLAHLVAIVILLHKIWRSRSCEGLSGRSQVLFAIVFVSRYLDLFTNFISVYNSVMKVMWTFSIYLESVAIMPQLFMLSRTGNAETITAHYLFALGSYRALYIVNWIFRYYTENFFDPIAVVAGIVQTVLYADFFYLYVTRVLQSNRQFEMPA